MLTENFISDLQKSLKTPLYIELSHQDVTNFLPPYEIAVTAHLPCVIASKIYNSGLPKGESNLLIVDAKEGSADNRFVLLEALIKSLESQLKNIKNVEALKKAFQGGLSLTTAGWLDALAGSYFDKGTEFVFEEINEFLGHFLVDNSLEALEVGEAVSSFISDALVDASGERLAQEIGKLEYAALSLSTPAKNALEELSSEFKRCTTADVFQLAFKLFSLVTLGAPKLLWINNPQYLDVNSLELLSLLFAQNKYYKEQGKPIGNTVVYQFRQEEYQPYKKFPETNSHIQSLLDNQRSFAQRYGMLERPTHDMPETVVKSSTFVGRADELRYLRSAFTGCQPGQITVVAGEPGIGKTTLITHHIKQISKSATTISLTLLNEAGSTSTNTGLSSLERSIIEETQRLVSLRRWREKGKDFAKQQLNIENAIKVISGVFGVSITGLDKLASTASKVAERLQVSSSLAKLSESGGQELNAKSAAVTERQFTKLDNAINALRQIGDTSSPIILFVDDLQWIDEATAQYLLTTRLKNKLYIIGSVRQSDAATLYSTRQDEAIRSQYNYVNKLFRQLSIPAVDEITQQYDVGAIAPQHLLTPHRLSLRGLTYQNLVEIIDSLLDGSEKQINALASGIISSLDDSPDNLERGPTSVNTLFAIETINVLFDLTFYKGFDQPLVIKKPSVASPKPFAINPSIESVSSALTTVFSHLKEKYRLSLGHFSSQQAKNGYSLMAYAVMEERLNLLRVYFGHFGDCAVFSLLISSLLGIPFSSKMVKNVIENIINSNDAELLAVQKLLPKKDDYQSLTEEHYAVLDEVYEIVKRLNYAPDGYQYKHGLFGIFFRQQLRFLLDSEGAHGETIDKMTPTFLLKILLSVIEDELKAVADAHEGPIVNHLSLPLLAIKAEASEFILQIDESSVIAGIAFVENTLSRAKISLNTGDITRVIELLTRLERVVDTNYVAKTVLEMESNKEVLLTLQAHAFGVQKSKGNTDRSLKAYEQLKAISSKKHKNHPFNNHKYYAREMSEVTEKTKQNQLTEKEGFEAYRLLYNEFKASELFINPEAKRLVVSLLMNMGACAPNKTQQKALFAEAHEYAYTFYKEDKDNGFSAFLEAKHKLYTVHALEMNADIDFLLRLLGEIYTLCCNSRSRVPGSFDEYYYPCVFRLIRIKRQLFQAVQTQGMNSYLLNTISSIDALNLPTMNAITEGFLALKESKPSIYEAYVGHFKAIA